MSRRTRNIILSVVCSVLICTALITLIGKWTDGSFDVVSELRGDRNEENLIPLGSYVIKTKKLSNGLEIEVDEDGVIKVSGKATADYEDVIATVTLEPGTYTIGGYATDLSKAGLKAVVDGASYYSGMSNDVDGETFTVTETTSVQIKLFVEKDANFVFATKFEPTLASGKTVIPFYSK